MNRGCATPVAWPAAGCRARPTGGCAASPLRAVAAQRRRLFAGDNRQRPGGTAAAGTAPTAVARTTLVALRHPVSRVTHAARGTRCQAAATPQGEPPASDALAMLEAHWEQLGPQRTVPADDAVAALAEATGLSAAQVQRWFARRVLSQSVARRTASAETPRAASAADAAGAPTQALMRDQAPSRRSSARAMARDDEDDEGDEEAALSPEGMGSWRRRLREDRGIGGESEDDIGTSSAEGEAELGMPTDEIIVEDDETAAIGALDGLDSDEFADAEDEDLDEEEDEDVEDLTRFGTSGIDAIARKQPAAAPAQPLRITDEMRRSSDRVDWNGLTAQSLKVVETALQPRKQEWLVLHGKPVPGSKEPVHEGPWFTGDAKLGWAALPDTEDMPRMVDGSMLEWANINTKLPNQEGYLEVDTEPPPSPDLQVIKWDDLPTPPMDEDIVYQHPDWEANGRTAHNSLEVGSTLTGFVVDQHLYHGAFIDCGTEYNGVIWVTEPDWIRVRDVLELGEQVTVRVTQVRDPVRFRFPLELECVSPDVSELLSRPAPEFPPINLYDDEDIYEAALDAGRYIPPPPDYEGMLASVRDEVAENFVAPKDAVKVKKAKSKTEDDWDDGEGDEEQQPGPAEEGDEEAGEEEAV